MHVLVYFICCSKLDFPSSVQFKSKNSENSGDFFQINIQWIEKNLSQMIQSIIKTQLTNDSFVCETYTFKLLPEILEITLLGAFIRKDLQFMPKLLFWVGSFQWMFWHDIHHHSAWLQWLTAHWRRQLLLKFPSVFHTEDLKYIARTSWHF